MTDFLLELRSEEIPARMQAKAREDLARLFAAELAKAGLAATETVTYATPRRLALIARGLPDATAAALAEVKGPPADAPDTAVDGFLRKLGNVSREVLETRPDAKGRATLFAVMATPGRATAELLPGSIEAIIRAFPWPKAMRWGEASASTESLRWVRPLHGIVALFGEELVPVEVAGVTSGCATLGHRFHHPGPITLGGAHDYVEKLRACHVIVDQAEREALIRTRAAELARDAGLELVEDEGLVAENAGLTEWPVPLLGRFDPAFLDVPPEVIQLTARVNQKYFVCSNPPRASLGEGDRSPQASGGGGVAGKLANAFICTANIDATDGGAAIVEGNRKVLAARLSDARFFYEQDLKVPLEEQAKKLDRIVFHEKLGTVADKVERVAKLARWLVEEGIVSNRGGDTASAVSPWDDRAAMRGGDTASAVSPWDDRAAMRGGDTASAVSPSDDRAATRGGDTASAVSPWDDIAQLATLAERAARLCKADLVTGMVGEFPELQGLIGGYYALAQGEDPRVAAAIRDHYRPAGQGDEVPTAPVTVAVSLADKLDTLFWFFAMGDKPTGSKDPYALRRACLGEERIHIEHGLRFSLAEAFLCIFDQARVEGTPAQVRRINGLIDAQVLRSVLDWGVQQPPPARPIRSRIAKRYPDPGRLASEGGYLEEVISELETFFADRLKVQQREAGVRHDLIDAVFALGGEDDLVRLLARVRALQAFMATEDGANLLTGYRRAANILKKEGYSLEGETRHPGLVPGSTEPQAATSAAPWMPGQARHDEKEPSYTPEIAEAALIAALDSAEPRAAAAVAAEDFAGAMAALASLRAPIDAFFDTVTVNDPDERKRAARLALLARMRDAVHAVADFSKIEG